MRVGRIIIAVSLCTVAACASTEQHCFRDHLEEAIDLNANRRGQYAAMAAEAGSGHDLSEQSEAVSDLLVGGEKKAVMTSHMPTWFWKGVSFDSAASKYQQAGIPIVCEDFVPIDEVPEVQLYQRPFPVLEARYVGRSKFDFDDAALSDFESVADVLQHEIERLSIEPRFNCMLRHLLESALRISNHAPIYADMAEMKGLPSPESLLWKMIESHFWLMDEVMEADRRAASLQAQGIPIICSDVPPVPPYSEALLQMYEEMRGSGDRS